MHEFGAGASQASNGRDFRTSVVEVSLREILLYLNHCIHTFGRNLNTAGRVEQERAELPVMNYDVNLLTAIAVGIDYKGALRTVSSRKPRLQHPQPVQFGPVTTSDRVRLDSTNLS